MNWLPFVSRGRFEDAQRQITDLKAELADAKKERRILADAISEKTLGYTIYGELKRPHEEEEIEPPKYSAEKDSNEPVVAQEEEMPVTRARDKARRVEKKFLQQQLSERAEQARLLKMAQEAVDDIARSGRQVAEVAH